MVEMEQRSMRVLVLGATGNVGTALLPRLQPQVEELVGVARRVPAGPASGGVRWVEADLLTSDLDRMLEGIDAVVHLAWVIQPSRRPERTWDVNVRGTARLLSALSRSGVGALVYASSVGAYSPGPVDRRVGESWDTHGIATSSYSREKAYVERLLDHFEAERPDVRVVRLRPGLIFQRQAASEIRRFFLGSLFVNALARPGRVPIFPTVRGLRFQAVHSDDVASAYTEAVLGDASGAFNIAAEPVLDLAAIAGVLDARPVRVPAAILRPAAHLTWRLRVHPVSPGWIDLAFKSPLLDTTRATQELQWQPRISATDAVSELLQGIADGAGAATPTLRPDRRTSRVDELATRQGQVYSTDPRTD